MSNWSSSDWNTPNITLNHGDIDANFFQHQPFLDNAKKETDFKIKAFAKGAATHVGLYSKKINSWMKLKDGAKVVVPNDPVNQGVRYCYYNRQTGDIKRSKQPPF
jgi:ABC-type metal ion transport system, periplasmic component/surface antigen